MSKAIKYSYRLLNKQPRSEKEIIIKLTSKGFSDKEIKETVRFLKEKDLVNDNKFALLWVENRLSENPCSKRLMRLKLIEKGITDEIISSVITADRVKEKELAVRLALTKILKMKKERTADKKKAVYSYLMNRGFEEELTLEAIREVINDEDI